MCAADLTAIFRHKISVSGSPSGSGQFPPRPLSPQEEIRTFAALRAGDPSAREKLIRHNLRLVAHIAKKYYALPSEQDDLISIGTIGLMKAVDTFDSTRRARFSTYASRCIENELRMHFRRERKLILLRYGLAGQPPLTQLETAKLLQISRSYVSRLETHALELLRVSG